MLHAVLTGDIVNFTKLRPEEEKQLFKALEKILKSYSFEFYRGDSFQVFIKEPQFALKIALLCRSAAITISQSCDIRISIGIGTVIAPVKKLGAAKGEAFLLSGRAFDKMQKAGARLVIASGNEMINEGLTVLANYIDSIYNNLTSKQATVINGLLKGETQQKMTDELNKSKSTIHQLTISGRWAEIERLLLQFETLINYLL